MGVEDKSFNCWAVVEILGHKRFAGHATVQEVAGVGFIRVDVPATEQPERWGRPARSTSDYSKLIGPSSIYCITPCTEEVARRAATVIEADNDPIPVALPVERQIPASVGAEDAQLDEFTATDDEDDWDDDDEEAEYRAAKTGRVE